MRSIKILLIPLFLCACGAAGYATVLSLDSCRSLALSNNRQLQMHRLEVKSAGFQEREAAAALLPAIDFTSGYMYNPRKISVFDSDQLLPTKSFNPETGKYEFNLVTNPHTGEPVKTPDGQYIPETVALIPKESMTYDTRNLFWGAVTITQPVYMGGRIIAANRIARYARQISETMLDNETQNVIYSTDAAYWQVVSVSAKLRLTTGYVSMLDTLRRNVEAMVKEGIATQSELLSVGVRLNQARVDSTKVANGLELSRMALADICGLPLNAPIVPEDVALEPCLPERIDVAGDMETALSGRSDLKALRLNVLIDEQRLRIARASLLPEIAVVGAYSFGSPNMFNGFSRRIDGTFSIGAMISVPIWHWGGNYNKLRVAKANIAISRLRLADASEKVSLQVAQASFKAEEAVKTLLMANSGLDSANENLRLANVSFREGLSTAADVMEAQVAWLKANAECIDAEVGVRLSRVYLSLVMGALE